MSLVLKQHGVRPVSDRTCLPVVARPRRHVVRAAAMDRLNLKEVVRGVALHRTATLRAPAVASLCAHTSGVHRPQQAVEAGIWDDARLTARAEQRRRQHRRKR